MTARTLTELRAERTLVYDRAIVLARLRGCSVADVARMNACSAATVGQALRRHGTVQGARSQWTFSISEKRAAKLDLTPDDLDGTGATKIWDDIWQSAKPLSDREWLARLLKHNRVICSRVLDPDQTNMLAGTIRCPDTGR